MKRCGLLNSGCASVLAMVCMMFAVSSEAVELYSTSFESPNITGRVTTVADGWVGGSYGTRRDGMEDEATGTFSTPYGEQAACIWNTASETVLTTAEAAFQNLLVTGITYTVTCHVARATDLSGYYKIQIMGFSLGADRRNYRDSAGVVLAQVTGTATTNDMSQMVTLAYTAPSSSPNVGKMLGVRIANPSVCHVDNLTFSRSGPAGDIEAPITLSTYPSDNATTMALDYYKLILTFNEPIAKGTGNITIKKSVDDSTVETIDVTSGKVTINGAVVTVTRNEVLLENAASYYVNIDSTAFVDLSGNPYVGISNKTTFNFSTPVAAGSTVIYETSFESPVVSGRVYRLPDGWVGGNYGAQYQAIENENSGTYTTPWGSQAVSTGAGQDPMTTKEITFNDTLKSNFPYTVTFNVALPTNVVGASYGVQLLAFNPGALRNDIYVSGGAVLASASGMATQPDMAAQAVGFTFTAAANNANLGRLLAVRIVQGNRCLVDNLKLTWVVPPLPSGTLFIIR